MSNVKTCLADQIKMHIDYALSNLYIDNEETKAIAYAFYKDLRGDLILNGLRPSAVAAAILYMACRASGNIKRQIDIAWSLNIATVSLRRYYDIFRKHFGFEHWKDPDDKPWGIPDEDEMHYHILWTTKRPIDIE